MGFNAIYNRKLKSLNVNIVMFFHAGIGVLIGSAILIVEAGINGSFRTFDSRTYVWLIAGSVTDTLCNNSLTIAFRNDRSGFVGLVSYMGVFWGFLADFLILKEDISWMEILGACIVLAASLTVSILKACQQYRNSKS